MTRIGKCKIDLLHYLVFEGKATLFIYFNHVNRETETVNFIQRIKKTPENFRQKYQFYRRHRCAFKR